MPSPDKKFSNLSFLYCLGDYQKQNESIPEYVAALQIDLTQCKFKVQCESSNTVSAADFSCTHNLLDA